MTSNQTSRATGVAHAAAIMAGMPLDADTSAALRRVDARLSSTDQEVAAALARYTHRATA